MNLYPPKLNSWQFLTIPIKWWFTAGHLVLVCWSHLSLSMQASVWPSWCFDQKTQPVSGVWRPSTPCVRWSNPGFALIFSAPHLTFAFCFFLHLSSHHHHLSNVALCPWPYPTFKCSAEIKNTTLCALPHQKLILFYEFVSKLGMCSKNLSLVWCRFVPRLSSRTCASTMWGGRLKERPEAAVVRAGLWGITWLSSLMPPAASASPHTRYCSFLLIFKITIQTNCCVSCNYFVNRPSCTVQ